MYRRTGVLMIIAACAVAGAASAQTSTVIVKGWLDCTKAPCPPQAVTTYSAEGIPNPGKQDLSALAIAGARQWNPAYGLVQVSAEKQLWVRARVLDLTYCDVAANSVKMPNAGGAQTATAMGMGSGPGCK